MYRSEFGRVVPFSFLLFILCGCGGIQSKNTNTLSVNPASIAFGNTTVGQTATANVSLQNRGLAAVEVTQLAAANAAFTVVGQSALPASIAPGATYSLTIKFSPSTASALNSQIDVVTNQPSGSASAIPLSGTGLPALSALSCNLSSISGAGTVACTISLNAAAPSGGFTIALSSSAGSVTLPSTVNVPGNATSVQFNASVATVTSAQSATLTASAGSSATTFALQLVPKGAALTFNSTTINFGTTTLNSPVTQSLVATCTGTSPVTLTAAALSGTGFTVSGPAFPISLNPGQSATLNVQFDPKSTGAVVGQLTIKSSALSNGAAAIGLSGTGVAYEVALNWNAPSGSSGSITGYKVYRSTGSSSNYQLLNSSPTQQTTYTDTTVQGGTTYEYIVQSVDSSGGESSPSNTTTVAVP